MSDEFVPKGETGAKDFLAAHPDYDGRGITIAIMDSGVDVSSPLLRTTSDGRVKVIEQVDCSGSGDIVTKQTTSEVVDGRIKAASGRWLTLNQEWKVTRRM